MVVSGHNLPAIQVSGLDIGSATRVLTPGLSTHSTDNFVRGPDTLSVLHEAESKCSHK